uniref:Photosystem I reaction center subunit IX n=1 Tax=Poterioochromonas malhamensis TaxID=88167 RepID=A0A7T6Y7K5_9STRA|nr:subunit IX of photosystem I [Poterioochromonas malhamensis]QQK55040.1 subunit IX of photosystem I [Poterioochromonas malhamensis]
MMKLLFLQGKSSRRKRKSIYIIFIIFLTMSDFLKYLSTAPVLLTVWLSITSIFVIFLNYLYPQILLYFN